ARDDEWQRLRRLPAGVVTVVQQDDGAGMDCREDAIDNELHAGRQVVLGIDVPGDGRESQRVSLGNYRVVIIAKGRAPEGEAIIRPKGAVDRLSCCRQLPLPL